MLAPYLLNLRRGSPLAQAVNLLGICLALLVLPAPQPCFTLDTILERLDSSLPSPGRLLSLQPTRAVALISVQPVPGFLTGLVKE